MKSSIIVVILWFLMVVACLVLFKSASWQKYPALARYGILVEGKIIKKDSDNHQTLHYQYIVSNGIFTGTGHGLEGGIPPFDSISIGDNVLVCYDSRNPNLSCLGDPKQEAKYAETRTYLLSLVFPTILTLGLYFKLNRKKISN